MKSLITMVLLAGTITMHAQDDVFANKTNLALEKVIKDFPNRFKNIKGDQIAQRPQAVDYRSTIQVPGASSCIVTKYAVPAGDSYGWTCTAYENHDFAQAKLKFKEIYDQVDNTIIKVDGEKPFILSGQYHSPQAERKSTVIVFDLLPATGDMKRLRVELQLQNMTSSWKVVLNVYDSNGRSEGATASN